MSVLTEVLKLFKYDPVADADSTFNITQALNNNWDKLDAAILLAIAAAGAYNPEESYAVGDYCTYKGKLHKCSTAIPTGETWTEAHWTTATVAAELAELSSQLSNLAGEKYTRIVSPPQSWAEVWALAPHVVYSWVQQTPLAWQPEDTPSGALRVELTIHNVASGTPSASRSAMLAYIDGATTLTRYVGEEMGTGASNGRWAKLATATSPQEFDLPLAEGYTQNNGCKYSKDQFNVVRVTFNLSKSAGTIAGCEVVATLPAGFRPKRYWACVAIGNNIPSDAATRHPVVVQVATNGEISASMMVETDQAELRAIVCAMEFLAAD